MLFNANDKKKPSWEAGTKIMDTWPDPLQLLEIRDAVRKGATKVTLDGREFTIKYRENGDFSIWPVEGFVPGGHFELEYAFKEL